MYKEVYDVLKTGGKLYTSCFGTKTQGYGTGKCIENGTYDDIESGVLAGRAIAHFFFKEELESTLKSVGFRNIVIDNILYTDNGVQVEQFIAQAEKIDKKWNLEAILNFNLKKKIKRTEQQ